MIRKPKQQRKRLAKKKLDEKEIAAIEAKIEEDKQAEAVRMKELLNQTVTKTLGAPVFSAGSARKHRV